MARPTRRLARSLALLALTSVSIAAATPGRAEPFLLPLEREGSWVEADKSLHFAGSAALALSARATGRGEEASFGIAFGIGVVKEAYDGTMKSARFGRGASRKDVVVDALGAAAGILLLRILER